MQGSLRGYLEKQNLWIGVITGRSADLLAYGRWQSSFHRMTGSP